MAHGKACANSSSPECDCSCDGRLHGTGLTIDPAGASLGGPSVATAPRRHKKRRRGLAATAIAFTVTGTVGGLAATGTFNSASGSSGDLSIQVNVDFKSIISELSSLGFGGKRISISGSDAPGNHTSCAESASRQVREFLNHHHCVQYQAQVWEITRQGATTRVAFSWVEMPSVSLASRYRAEVDAYSTGNPPGISAAFNGHCYASAQQDSTVQTVEVEPTGNVGADRQILQAAALRVLSSAYLGQHCIE